MPQGHPGVSAVAPKDSPVAFYRVYCALGRSGHGDISMLVSGLILYRHKQRRNVTRSNLDDFLSVRWLPRRGINGGSCVHSGGLPLLKGCRHPCQRY